MGASSRRTHPLQASFIITLHHHRTLALITRMALEKFNIM